MTGSDAELKAQCLECGEILKCCNNQKRALSYNELEIPAEHNKMNHCLTQAIFVPTAYACWIGILTG